MISQFLHLSIALTILFAVIIGALFISPYITLKRRIRSVTFRYIGHRKKESALIEISTSIEVQDTYYQFFKEKKETDVCRVNYIFKNGKWVDPSGEKIFAIRYLWLKRVSRAIEDKKKIPTFVRNYNSYEGWDKGNCL